MSKIFLQDTTTSSSANNDSLKTENNLNKFNTSELTTMEFMFYKCSNISILDLSSFNTEKVTSTQFMFNSCKSLSELNLSNFNLKNCNTFTSMFTGVKDLKVIINDNEDNKVFLDKFRDKLTITK